MAANGQQQRGAADPDGYDATDRAGTAVTGTPYHKDRKAAAIASLRGMSALELEPDDYDYDYDCGGDYEEEEEETSSLVRECAGFGNGLSRRPPVPPPLSSSSPSHSSIFQRLYNATVMRVPERSSNNDALPPVVNQNVSLRNLILITALAALMFLFVDNADVALDLMNHTTGDSVDESAGYQYAPHESSFGGINNMGHPAGAKAADAGGFDAEDIFIPVSNVGHAVQSITAENVLNYQGHYAHDEHRSPYASHLYDRPQAEIDEEQDRFVAKMNTIRQEWGAWNFTDVYWRGEGRRPVVDFADTHYRDVPSSSFPDGSWQTDKEYTVSFITEAKALVDRVREGIYAEYGKPTKKADGTIMSEEERAARDAAWGVDHVDGAEAKGIAKLNEHSWNGLIRKLLHAIITHDEFYVVLGGHSSAAGHGNNFRQTKAMQFHYLMEPVLDKLGVRLITRNSAQGGVGTTHSAFAGASIYGEKDIFLWDSGMTEKDPGALDTFLKQGILGGERVPVIFDCSPQNVVAETDGLVWLGTTDMNGAKLDHIVTTDEKQAEAVPWALRWSKCDKNRADLCQAHKYNSVCWEERKDLHPPTKQTNFVGGRAGWHPGNITHKRMARVWSLMVLHALDAALDFWKENIDQDGGFPLTDEYWHVGEEYLKVQNTLRTHINSKPLEVKQGEEDTRSACEKKFSRWPRVCRVAMKAYGEWQPRVNPDHTSLRSILKPAPNGYVPDSTESSLYDGIDLALLDHSERGTFPRIPDEEIDVHMIVIATTKAAPDLDHSVPDSGERRRLADVSRRTMLLRLDRAKESFYSRWTYLTRKKKTRRDKSRSLRQPYSSNSTSSSNVRRKLDADEDIIPGQGWTLASSFHVGYCDGSYSSSCARSPGSDCLEIAHNDGRGCLEGDPLAGWIVFKVPDVKEGIILVRLEWWHGTKGNARTRDWTVVNDGKTTDTAHLLPESETAAMSNLTARALTVIDPTGRQENERRRRLGKIEPLSEDFLFDIAIDGKVVKTMNKEEFLEHGGELVKNFAIWPIMDDPEWSKRDWGDSDGEEVEVGLRFRSSEVPHKSLGFSHVYYA